MKRSHAVLGVSGVLLVLLVAWEIWAASRHSDDYGAQLASLNYPPTVTDPLIEPLGDVLYPNHNWMIATFNAPKYDLEDLVAYFQDQCEELGLRPISFADRLRASNGGRQAICSVSTAVDGRVLELYQPPWADDVFRLTLRIGPEIRLDAGTLVD